MKEISDRKCWLVVWSLTFYTKLFLSISSKVFESILKKLRDFAATHFKHKKSTQFAFLSSFFLCLQYLEENRKVLDRWKEIGFFVAFRIIFNMTVCPLASWEEKFSKRKCKVKLDVDACSLLPARS